MCSTHYVIDSNTQGEENEIEGRSKEMGGERKRLVEGVPRQESGKEMGRKRLREGVPSPRQDRKKTREQQCNEI